MKSEVIDAARVIREGSTFLVAGHMNPDGDSLGSMCAMILALKNLGKTPIAVSPDGVPDNYQQLPGTDLIVREAPGNQSYDAAIIVDCENLGRLGPVEDLLESAKRLIEIDHHPGGERGSDIQIVDPSSASTGELVYELLRQLNVKINPAIAECLLTAIVTDTGCFRFSNVKSSTFRTAADLLDSGASIGRIVRRVYETRSLTHAKLLGAALSSLDTVANGRVAYASISREDLQAAEGEGSEGEGIVNYVRSIRGAQVGILFREEADGTTRVSLRSGDSMDISQVARLFGGGGHRSAAGCTIERPLPEAIDLVLGAVQKWMAS